MPKNVDEMNRFLESSENKFYHFFSNPFLRTKIEIWQNGEEGKLEIGERKTKNIFAIGMIRKRLEQFFAKLQKIMLSRGL